MTKNRILLALMLTTTIASASTSSVDDSVGNLASAQHTAAIAFQLNAPDVVDYNHSRFTANQVVDAANSFSKYANEDVAELNKKIQALHDMGITLDYTSAKIAPDSSPDKVYTFMFNSFIEMLRNSTNGFTEDSVVARDYVLKSDYDSALLAARNGFTEDSVVARDYVAKSVVANDYVEKSVVANDYVEKTAHDSALLAARNGFTEDSVVARDYVAKSVVANDYVEKTAHDSAILTATSGKAFSTLEALHATTSADNKYDSVKGMIDQGVKSLEETAAIAKDKIDNPPAIPTATKTRAEIIDDLVSHLGARAQRDQRIALNAMDAGTFEAQYGAFTS